MISAEAGRMFTLTSSGEKGANHFETRLVNLPPTAEQRLQSSIFLAMKLCVLLLVSNSPSPAHNPIHRSLVCNFALEETLFHLRYSAALCQSQELLHLNGWQRVAKNSGWDLTPPLSLELQLIKKWKGCEEAPFDTMADIMDVEEEDDIMVTLVETTTTTIWHTQHWLQELLDLEQDFLPTVFSVEKLFWNLKDGKVLFSLSVSLLR